MISTLEQTLRELTVADAITGIASVQQLWSGYGEIMRVELAGSRWRSVIVKAIQYPKPDNHPRGWQSDFAHQRKLRSYQVELVWYRQYAHLLPAGCVCPQLIAEQASEDELLLVMEDLAQRYPSLPQQIELAQVKLVLTWLAQFHGHFLQEKPAELWPIGTYWHLKTRPDEFAAMNDQELKAAAGAIDQKLNQSQFNTWVHGDAKLANFCFSENLSQVAAVDFQYVGGGCGMKDVAYFLSSCMSSEQCFEHEQRLLDHYFCELEKACRHKVTQQDWPLLERQWRELYNFAWADFERFLNGWSPNHWKVTPYAQQKTLAALSILSDVPSG